MELVTRFAASFSLIVFIIIFFLRNWWVYLVRQLMVSMEKMAVKK